MDSLDSISSSGCSLAGSSSNGSAGAHSRQVSTDSTSSPTNFTSPTSYVNNRIIQSSPNNPATTSYNPHQFIKAGPSVLHKSVSMNSLLHSGYFVEISGVLHLKFILQASEQIKVVKEVVKIFRAPVKEDEEEWQQVFLFVNQGIKTFLT